MYDSILLVNTINTHLAYTIIHRQIPFTSLVECGVESSVIK